MQFVFELSNAIEIWNISSSKFVFQERDFDNLADGQSIEGSSDVGLFIYQEGNYPIYLGTNSKVRFTILGNGNIGIGTTSPGALLELAETSGNLTFIMNNDSHGDNCILQFDAENAGGTNKTCLITWDPDTEFLNIDPVAGGGINFITNQVYQTVSSGQASYVIDNNSHGDNTVIALQAETAGGAACRRGRYGSRACGSR